MKISFQSRFLCWKLLIFYRNAEPIEYKDQGDEVKELVRLGILPEDYENISLSDDSD